MGFLYVDVGAVAGSFEGWLRGPGPDLRCIPQFRGFRVSG